jgi:hypothetical protein
VGQWPLLTFIKVLTAGWTERSNVQIDYHWIGGDADRARAYAAETVRAKPDVILADGTTVVAALQPIALRSAWCGADKTA